jgi:hypothetical protein
MAVACSDTEPAGPEAADIESQTVNAADGWAFVAYQGENAAAVSVNDRAASALWDLGFFATSVMLNGGAAGPAGVVGHCLCQNASATDAEVVAMTAESELAVFESVTEVQIPTVEGAWQSDALAAAVDGWYSYDPVTHIVSAVRENAWKIRTASGTSYAKFRVTGLANGTQQHAGRITFEYAVQAAAGAAFGPAEAATVDVSSGAVDYDLDSSAVVTGSPAWDLRFDGYDIRVNGGVSGGGSAGASLSVESFDAMTDASDLTASHYRGDAFGGVFEEHPWYRYNLQGNHQIWPTYDVYLIRRGEAVYKVQLTSYYGPTGESRQITFRYARLR